MPYKIDFFDGEVVEWSLTDDGATSERVLDYTPTFYVGRGEGDETSLQNAERNLEKFPTVAETRVETWRPGFRHGGEAVLRVDCTSVEDVTRLGRWLHERGRPGEYRCFNVDFSREFRYCLERGRPPTPERELTTLAIEGRAHEFGDTGGRTHEFGDTGGRTHEFGDTGGRTHEFGAGESEEQVHEFGAGESEEQVHESGAGERELPEVVVGGERVGRSPEVALPRVEEIVAREDPDVLVVDSARLLAALHDLADRLGYDFNLGRRPGFQRLARESTYTSYGRVGHSPARYNVPGRVLVDRSNTFFYDETNVAGCVDLVRRSGKPLQELSWASIGNVLTAIQIREALSRNVLVPWRAWRPEQFKTMGQLHDADRGGFTFAPDVGVHEAVHELDFSSLYPNIICEYNVSPETIRCDCHRGREDVPGLGYCICDEEGYLPDVLGPLVEARDELKAELRATDDPERAAELEGRSDAIKWILVSCFGYQGFSNAKFGRIECHEAINAFAREILLDAKETLEDGGWRVVHGIVDSIWVTPRDGVEQESLNALAAEISDEAGIRLEYEAEYDWVAFVPMRDSEAGALTKYFGALASGDDYKYRGIECRQRSTSAFVAEVQRELIAVYDEYRSPEAVCDRVQAAIRRLRSGEVDPEALAVKSRVSKRAEEYRRSTRTVAALESAADAGRDVRPGQSVAYVVVDDSKSSRDRVALAGEAEEYDAKYYAEQVIRAAESVLSPLGWREGDIRRDVAEREDASLSRY